MLFFNFVFVIHLNINQSKFSWYFSFKVDDKKCDNS